MGRDGAGSGVKLTRLCHHWGRWVCAAALETRGVRTGVGLPQICQTGTPGGSWKWPSRPALEPHPCFLQPLFPHFLELPRGHLPPWPEPQAGTGGLPAMQGSHPRGRSGALCPGAVSRRRSV